MGKVIFIVLAFTSWGGGTTFLLLLLEEKIHIRDTPQLYHTSSDKPEPQAAGGIS